MTPAAKAEWRKLKALAKRPPDIRDLFALNPQRAKQWALEGGGVFLDSSKSLASDETLAALCQLARAAEAPRKLAAQMRGERVNFTENRPAWHSALRRQSPPPDSERELNRATQFAEDIRNGNIVANNGERFSHVLHIGIGGSHLGPELLRDALAPIARESATSPVGPQIRFVANADPAALSDAWRGTDPRSTMVVAVSKSFSTGETLENARAAKAKLASALGNDGAPKHFAAVTANPAAARDFGIPPGRIFTMDEWVGGRCSLWSAASLSAVAAIGADAFREFLRGGREMDSHALESPPEKSVPLRMALLGIWHCNFLGAQTHCVVAYQHRLRGFARYLQQLVMESNGKSACENGKRSGVDTGEIVWGGEGTNDQHSYFQLLAQGTRTVPADFIVAQRPSDGNDGNNGNDADNGDNGNDAESHRRLLAHALGWSRALAMGRDAKDAESESLARGTGKRTAKKLSSHQACAGNRPSNVVMIPKLTPRTLGSLVSLYEHKVALQSFIWGINAFDQWGVESGKTLTREIANAIQTAEIPPDLDPSTRLLLSRL